MATTEEINQMLQRLHQIAREQQSRLTFLDVEINVVRSMIENHCSLMKYGADTNRFQFICGQLSQLNMLKLNITNDFIAYHNILNIAIEGSLIKTPEILKLESERIDLEIADLNKSFKRLKKQLLSFRKNAIQGEVLKSVKL